MASIEDTIQNSASPCHETAPLLDAAHHFSPPGSDHATEITQMSSKPKWERLSKVGFVLSVCLPFLLVGLDSTIVAICVPHLVHDFSTALDIGWYSSAYRLAAGGFQLFFGKLYSVLPAKHLAVAVLIVFAVGNLLCGLAQRSSIFILGRAIAGFATAGTISGTFAIIIQNTPLQARSRYAGLGAAVEATSSLCAPLIGGALIDSLSWRWCFFIQLPLTVAAILFIVLFSHGAGSGSDHTPISAADWRRFDFLGTCLFVFAVAALISGLEWGGNTYAWSYWPISTIFSISVALFASFFLLQYHLQEQATLPPRILHNRTVIFGLLFSFCNNAALSIIEYYMPLYLQIVYDISSFQIGLAILPTAAGLIISVLLAGILTARFGHYHPFMLLTGIFMPIATGMFITLRSETLIWNILLYQALLGFAAGIGFQGPQVAVQAVFSRSDSQIGLGIIQLAQGIGPAIFVAVAQAIFANNMHWRSVPPVGSEEYTRGWSDGGGGEMPGAWKHTPDFAHLYSAAFVSMFRLPVALACLTIIGALGIEWRSIKHEQG